MILYLDTHAAAWLAFRELDKLSPTALQAVEDHDLRISPIVLLELEYLHEIKRTLLPAVKISAKLHAQLDVLECQLSFSAVCFAALSETWTRDPFDRLIVAHARANAQAPLLSADKHIQANYPATIW